MDIPVGLISTLIQGADLSDRFKIPLQPSARKQLKKSLEAALGTIPDSPIGALRSLVAESDLHAFDFRRGSQLWARAYYVLGLPAAILATTAGAAGLASTAGRIPAAITALVSAALTAAATFLNSEQNRKKNDELSAAWQALADQARIFMLQCVQKMDSQVPGDVFGPQYWSEVLYLQRRKSQLLRGDLSQSEPIT